MESYDKIYTQQTDTLRYSRTGCVLTFVYGEDELEVRLSPCLALIAGERVHAEAVLMLQ